jgi:predicted DNA-binding transcriptional regulator AlpA
MLERVYRQKEVLANFYRGSRAKFADDVAKGNFPAADVKISKRISGWSESTLAKKQAEQKAAALASTKGGE